MRRNTTTTTIEDALATAGNATLSRPGHDMNWPARHGLRGGLATYPGVTGACRTCGDVAVIIGTGGTVPARRSGNADTNPLRGYRRCPGRRS